MLAAAVDVRARRAGQGRSGSQVPVFGVPFRAGTAHVVQIGSIRAFAAEASTPGSAQGFEEIVPHGTLRTMAPQ